MLSKLEIKTKSRATYLSIGVVLVLLGSGYLISSYLKSNWIIYISILISGLIFTAFGFASNADGLKIVGTLALGSGIGLILLENVQTIDNPGKKVGYGLFLFALCWVILAIVLGGAKNVARLWPLILATILFPFATMLILDHTTYLHFILAGCIGIGFSLAGWGIVKHLFGLIIPGSILMTTGPGIFYAWRPEAISNGLSQTGIMLVWFAVGWVIIALSSRFLFSQVIWWPLIPAGVLAFVGWGLVLGGNELVAKNFIGNSGSIIVILIGLYLLLLRKDIHK